MSLIVQKLRLQRGWSQQQLADLSGLSVRTVQRIEGGQNATFESLKALAAVFEVDFQALRSAMGDQPESGPAASVAPAVAIDVPPPPPPSTESEPVAMSASNPSPYEHIAAAARRIDPQLAISDDEIRAFRHVRRLRGFYIHLMIYVAVITGLVILNLWRTPERPWVLGPAFGWGIGIVAHALSVFGGGRLFGPQWERRQVEKQLGRKLALMLAAGVALVAQVPDAMASTTLSLGASIAVGPAARPELLDLLVRAPLGVWIVLGGLAAVGAAALLPTSTGALGASSHSAAASARPAPVTSMGVLAGTAAAAASVLLAAVPADASAAGFRRVELADADGAIELAIWYPSAASPQSVKMGPIEQTVAIGAPVRGGERMPLVVISHGTGGSTLSHFDTAIALADAGFVVAAPAHPGDNYRDTIKAQRIDGRMRHMTVVLDHLIGAASPVGAAAVDASRIGILGMSAGGYTALRLIGGDSDLSKTGPYCRDNPTHYVCGIAARRRDGEAPFAAGRVKDARIKAAVIAAPALGFTFDARGLEAIGIPVQLWRAEADTVLPEPHYVEAVRRSMPKAEYRVAKGAGHYDFLAPCSADLAALAREICEPTPGFDRAAFKREFDREVVAFFKRTIGAAESAR